MAFKNPQQVFESAVAAGKAKGSLGADKLVILGFLAGAYIAFGGLLAVLVGGGLPGIAAANPGLQKLIFGAVFPVGLMLVVIAGSELFTGNTACCMASACNGDSPWRACLRNWVLSYLGNFAGAVFVAFFLAHLTGLVGPEPWRTTVVGIAEGKVAQGFGQLFLKGVGCNWLVCLAVWMAIAAADVGSKIWAIWFPIMAFVALGFEHSVANMFFVPLGIFSGAEATWGQFLIRNLIPVTLGNLLGGGFFVGVIYWYLYGRRGRRGG